MTSFRFEALPRDVVQAYRSGGADANGQAPEQHISDGSQVPCRYCLEDVPEGEAFLILAHRPFPAAQPYAEVGPIFLHAADCSRHEGADEVPEMVRRREKILIRGYGHDDRIVYGTGQVIATADIAEAAEKLLERPDIAYIHLRSSLNNCYQCRIDRA